MNIPSVFMCDVCQSALAYHGPLPPGAPCSCPTPQQLSQEIRVRWNERLSLMPGAAKDLTVSELSEVAWLLNEVDRCHEGWSDETAEADRWHAEGQAMTKVVEFVKQAHRLCFNDRCELCGLLAHVKYATTEAATSG